LTVSSNSTTSDSLGRTARALRPRLRTASARRRKEITAAYLFLAPGFLLFALVILYPIVRAFQISLYNWSLVPGTASRFLGLHNYNRAIHDPIFWRALENTGFYMAVTVPGQIVLGLLAAVLLDAWLPARGLFRTLFYIPVVTSWVVVSLRWTAMLALSILGVWKGVGWAMVIFLAALQGVPVELKEAAAVDGAKAWARFRAVSLSAIRPVVAFVTVMLVIGSFNVFISVFLMTKGGPLDETQVILTYMYRWAFSYLDFGYGSALSFILTLIVFVLAVGQLRLFRRPSEARA
jgi:multiple sugar transport system permease protein